MTDTGNQDRILWTADAIGQKIGRSAAYVRRTLFHLEGSPVQRHGRGNYFAVESELLAFLSKHRDRDAA